MSLGVVDIISNCKLAKETPSPLTRQKQAKVSDFMMFIGEMWWYIGRCIQARTKKVIWYRNWIWMQMQLSMFVWFGAWVQSSCVPVPSSTTKGVVWVLAVQNHQTEPDVRGISKQTPNNSKLQQFTTEWAGRLHFYEGLVCIVFTLLSLLTKVVTSTIFYAKHPEVSHHILSLQHSLWVANFQSQVSQLWTHLFWVQLMHHWLELDDPEDPEGSHVFIVQE